MNSSRLRQLWQKHKFRFVLACLLLCFVGFTSYDVYDTTKQTAADSDSNDGSTTDTKGLESYGDESLVKQKSMYETNPELVWDDLDERRQETEDQLLLEKKKHKSKQKSNEVRREHLISQGGDASFQQRRGRSHGDSSQEANSSQGGIYTGYHLTSESHEIHNHIQQSTSCNYVKLFGSLEEVRIHDEVLHNQKTLTYDSEHFFCDVSDLDLATKCCGAKSRIVRDFHESCNENSRCCGSMPDCVAHCSFIAMNNIKTADGMLLGEPNLAEKRQIFEQCENECRIDSRSINHNRYFNDDFQKFCHKQKLDAESLKEQNDSNVKIVIARPNEDCNKACSRLDEDPVGMLPGTQQKSHANQVQRPTRLDDHSKMHPQRVSSLTYQCSVPALHKLNSCEMMQHEYGCSECTPDFESFSPAFSSPTTRQQTQQTTSDDGIETKNKQTEINIIDKEGRNLETLPKGGECIVASHSMLLNCDNTSTQFQRICPCVPLPLIDNTASRSSTSKEENTNTRIENNTLNFLVLEQTEKPQRDASQNKATNSQNNNSKQDVSSVSRFVGNQQ